MCDWGELCTNKQCVPASGAADVIVATKTVTHAISPEIYGVALATEQGLRDSGATLNRWGGNAATRYNWQNGVTNTARDWFFQNVMATSPFGVEAEGAPGDAGFATFEDVFVRGTIAAGASTLITIPTIGYVAKADDKSCGYPSTQYPDQLRFDEWRPQCGNGENAQGVILGGETSWQNTSMQVGPEFATMHVAALLAKFGAQRPRFYALDNEMMLWSHTHSDVHPKSVSYAEVLQKTFDYAPAIKAADPSAIILGYGTWNVADTLKADVPGEEQQYGAPLLAWYLKQLAAYEASHGKRLVDCVDLHYYPQQDAAQEARRLEAPRSLWDPQYVEPDWLGGLFANKSVQFLPRVRQWIRENYPGTGICVSEYNFWPDRPEAAILQADVLGIFGREGVRLAAWWQFPWNTETKAPTPAYWAFRLYRNYDGAGGKFGDQALAAASKVADLAAYAAKRSEDGATTVVLVNRTTEERSLTLELTGSTATSAKAYSLQVGSTSLTELPAVTVTGGMVSVKVSGPGALLLVTL
ncbi:MAG: endoglucanase [Polyangiaceae bacterium]|nr:endoglucanase [Polyangiaceae bacterium]